MIPRKLLTSAVLAVVLMGWATAGQRNPAAAAPTAQSPANGWQATYWNNTELSGEPVLQIFETDPTTGNPELDRNWGNWRPWPQVEKDYFSARWTRTVDLQPGRYRFAGTADDGIRVYVNGRRIIDEWQNQVVRSYTGYIDLDAGPATITVEYYENQHDAIAKLTWDRIFGSDTFLNGRPYQPRISNWKGEYFTNPVVAGSPALVRDDARIDFDWQLDSPAITDIPANDFSVRWTRTLDLPAGTYRFKTETDDGVRLFLNGRMVIDQWRQQVFSPHTADIAHPGGAINVRMEYYDALGLAAAKLTWERIGDAPAGTGTAAPQTAAWRGEYYNNRILATAPVLVRNDAAVNFSWENGETPDTQYITRDGYSARWTGVLDLAPGDYIFSMLVDDGARLWVDNNLVLDKWRKQPETGHEIEVSIDGGRVPVKLEYYNELGAARIHLTWRRADGSAETGGLAVPGRHFATGSGGSADGNPSPPENETDTAVIRTAAAKVRDRASLFGRVIGTLRRTQEVDVLGRSPFNNWLQVMTPAGEIGYVSLLDVTYDADVTALPVAAVPQEAVPAADETAAVEGPYFVTVGSRLNRARSAPNALADTVAVLPVNEVVQAYGRDRYGAYVQVDVGNGDTGWISAAFVTADFPLDALPEVTP